MAERMIDLRALAGGANYVCTKCDVHTSEGVCPMCGTATVVAPGKEQLVQLATDAADVFLSAMRQA